LAIPMKYIHNIILASSVHRVIGGAVGEAERGESDVQL
jgi:hypothetical protein